MKRLKDIWEDTIKRHIRNRNRVGGLGYGKA